MGQFIGNGKMSLTSLTFQWILAVAQGEVALDLVRGWHLGDVHRDLATPWKGQGAVF